MRLIYVAMMTRLLQPFVLAVTAILLVAYSYLASRLAAGPWQQAALAVPFVLVWIVPVVYWGGGRRRERILDKLLHQASYLCMAWISFLLVLTLARDALLLLTLWPPPLQGAHQLIDEAGVPLVLAASLVAMVVGALAALRGPHVKRIDIAVEGLHPDLEGYRIAQITDLHCGPTIGRRYVERVVQLTEELAPELVALTGDMVDGPVEQLAVHVEPLRRIAAGGRAFFVLGNHDCYSGADAWLGHFREMGMRVLLNASATLVKGEARLLVGGVVDPALAISRPGAAPRPDLAAQGGEAAHFRLLLAHNPRIAPLAARAGFDMQISGHTHAGQFFPWTLAIRLVHAPHVAGLSREGRMWVYVSAGTGTWGPPVRFGTSPELTLIRLLRR
jgi:predicted MPP superfamily phosphohydrolase